MLTLNPKHPQLTQVTKMIMAIQNRLSEIEKEKFDENQREVGKTVGRRSKARGRIRKD